MRRTLSISIIAVVIVSAPLAAPAGAIVVVDDPWTWTLAEVASEEMVLATEAVHPDLAGPGLNVQAWPASGALGFPRWGTLVGSTQWGAPTDVSGSTGIPGLGIPSGSGGSLTVDGPVARWDLDISARPIIGGALIEWQRVADALFTALTPSDAISAIGADLSSTTSRAWVADLGEPGWVAFIDDGGANSRAIMVPDGFASLDVYGGSYAIVQRLLATAPCELDRSAVLQPLADGDVTAPITDRQQRDLLRCAHVADVITLGSGETTIAPISIPPTITSGGWLDDRTAIGMRTIGLPDGLVARLIDDGTGGLALELTGTAPTQEVEVEIVLWREDVAQDATIRVEPVTGIVRLRVTGPQLADTGAATALAPLGVAAGGLVLFGALFLAMRRRHALR